MIATVNKVEFNVKLGKYTVTKLSVKTDKGDNKSYNVFTNAPYHDVVRDLKSGDTIEVTMKKEGEYWNVADVKRAQAAEGSHVPAPTSEGKGGGFRQAESPNKDIAIARAVALKAGVELYCAMISAGLVKKTLKPDAAVEEVFAITKRFEGYATLAEDIESLASDNSSIKSGGGEYEETPFE